MIEKDFVKKGIEHARLEEFLEKQLDRANYSKIFIYKTPTSTRIIIRAQKPGIVIGRGGEKINKLIEALKNNFNIENPVVEAEEVIKVDLDAKVVTKNIAGWLEKGGNAKRVASTYLKRIMSAGAIGAQVEISGKLSGERKRTVKIKSGCVKRCGGSAKEYVEIAKATAVTKPGTIGVTVRIMTELPEYYYRKRFEKNQLEQIQAKKTLELKKTEEEKGIKKDTEEKEIEGKSKESKKTEEKNKKENTVKIPEEILTKKIKEIKSFLKEKKTELTRKEFVSMCKELIKQENGGKARKTLLDTLNTGVSG